LYARGQFVKYAGKLKLFKVLLYWKFSRYTFCINKNTKLNHVPLPRYNVGRQTILA
jgi:hypothetical protein